MRYIHIYIYMGFTYSISIRDSNVSVDKWSFGHSLFTCEQQQFRASGPPLQGGLHQRREAQTVACIDFDAATPRKKNVDYVRLACITTQTIKNNVLKKVPSIVI